MQFFNYLFLFAYYSHLTIARPFGLQDGQFAKPSLTDVSKAVDNFAKDADIVSNALNTLPSMTDKNQIKSTALKAFRAETDEDNHRSILAAAAGFSGQTPNSKIQKYTPTVLKALKDMADKGTTASVQKDIPIIEGVRNSNILPSITQLSNAAISSSGLQKDAKEFPKTTGSSKIKSGKVDKNDVSSSNNTNRNKTDMVANNKNKDTSHDSNDDDSN